MKGLRDKVLSLIVMVVFLCECIFPLSVLATEDIVPENHHLPALLESIEYAFSQLTDDELNDLKQIRDMFFTNGEISAATQGEIIEGLQELGLLDKFGDVINANVAVDDLRFVLGIIASLSNLGRDNVTESLPIINQKIDQIITEYNVQVVKLRDRYGIDQEIVYNYAVQVYNRVLQNTPYEITNDEFELLVYDEALKELVEKTGGQYSHSELYNLAKESLKNISGIAISPEFLTASLVKDIIHAGILDKLDESGGIIDLVNTFDVLMSICKEFFIPAPAIEDVQLVAEAKAALTEDVIKGSNTALTSVTTDLSLPGTIEGLDGVTIEWSTTNSAVNATTGAVTRPAWDDGNATGQLEATIKKGTAEDTQVFDVTVLKNEPPVTVAIDPIEVEFNYSIPLPVQAVLNNIEADAVDVQLFNSNQDPVMDAIQNVLVTKEAGKTVVDFEIATSLEVGEYRVAFLESGTDQQIIDVLLRVVEPIKPTVAIDPIEVEFNYSIPLSVNAVINNIEADAVDVQLFNSNQDPVMDAIQNVLVTKEAGKTVVDFEIAASLEVGEYRVAFLESGTDQQIIDALLRVVEPPVIETIIDGRQTTELRGLNDVEVIARFIPYNDDADNITLVGTNDYGTVDTADDIDFQLVLPVQSPNEFADFSVHLITATKFTELDNPSDVIPVNIGTNNNISLAYVKDNEDVVNTNLVWRPAQFELIDEDEDDLRVELNLSNTGLTEPKVVIEGVNTSDPDNLLPFEIVLHKEWPMHDEPDWGNFRRELELVDRQSFLPQNLDQDPWQIPVDLGQQNTIEFTLSQEKDGIKTVLAQEQFILNLDIYVDENNVWNNAWIKQEEQPGFENLITEVPELNVEIDNFLGDPANLTIELWYTEDVQNVQVATLSNVTEVTGGQQGQRLFRFTAEGDEAGALADVNLNNRHLEVKLIYDFKDPVLQNKAQHLGGIRIDNLPPGSDIGVDFVKIEDTGVHDGKYCFRVYLNDTFGTDPNTNTLFADNFTLLRKGVAVEDTGKAVVPFHEDQEPENSPYRQVYIYLTDFKSEDVLSINNLTDLAGHTMTVAVGVKLHLDSQLEGTLRTNDGVPVPYAEVVLIPYSEAAGLDLSDESFRHLHTDELGKFHSEWLPVGTYRAMQVEWFEGNKDERVYLDQEVTIPIMGHGKVYQLDLTLPPDTPNVQGSIDESCREILVFVNTAYLNDSYNAQEREKFYHMAAAEVETNDDGTFSLYLPTGNYKLVGRMDGFSFVPPVTPVEFTVNELGAVVNPDVLNDISFPEANVSGTIRDALGFVSYAGLGIVRADNPSEMWKIDTDHKGEFDLALADGDYKILGVMVFPKIPEFYPGADMSMTGITLSLSEVDKGYAEPIDVRATGFTNLDEDIDVQLHGIDGPIEDAIVADSINVDFENYAVDFQIAPGLEPGKYMIVFSNSGVGDYTFDPKPGEGDYMGPLNDPDNPGQLMGEFAKFAVKGPERSGGLYLLDVNFTLENGQVTSVSGNDLATGAEENTLLDVILPDPNVTVKLTEGEIPVTDEGRLLFTVLGEQVEAIGNGIYNFYLTPATYEFQEVELWGMNWRRVDLNVELVVDESTDLTGEYALEIDLQGSANVIVSFKDEEGQPTGEGFGLGIEKEGSWEFFWNQANADGKIYLQLTPGKYKINGYDDNGTWKELRQTFEVTAQHDSSNQLPVFITVKAPNVNGVVKDDDGNPILYAWVNVKRLPGAGELFSSYFGFSTDENGEFSTTLELGDYVVEGVGTQEQWYEMNFKFTVVEEGIIVQGETCDSLEIAKPADNVTGKVYKSYFDETTSEEYSPEVYQEMGIELVNIGVDKKEADEMPWMYRKWVKVKPDGTFGINLDEGDQYAVAAVTTHNRYIEFNTTSENAITFKVGENSTGLIVAPPKPNFFGVVQDFDGNLVTRGWLNVEKADYTEWHWTPIESDGTFGKALKTGEKYIIRDVTYFDAEDWDDAWNGPTSWEKEKRINFNREITIGPDSQDIVLSPNVKGTFDVSGMNIGDMNDYHIGVIIRQDKDWEDMTEDERMNPWKYEQYASLEIDTDGEATFYAYLDAGDGNGKNYLLAGIPAPNQWIEINESFTIGSPLKDKYEVNFDLTQNVIGTITSADGMPISDVWVDFKEVLDNIGDDSYRFERYFGTHTDVNGYFALKLKEGTYRLNGYHTQGKWVGKRWQSGKWTEVGYKFKVNAMGKLTDMNDVPMDSISIKPNLFGSVKKYYRSGDDKNWIVEANVKEGDLVTVKHAWLTIKPAIDNNYTVNKENWKNSIWANTGQDGLFTLMLSPGKYKVVEAGGMNFWMPLDIKIDVAGDGTVTILPADYQDEKGNLIIKPEAPNVKGYAYKSYTDADNNQPVRWGWMAIKPAHYKDWQWDEQVRWVEIKKGGYFETKLADGDWKITEVSGNNYWFKYEARFTVSGDEITSNQPGLVVNGQLFLAPPENNFKGVVKHKNGDIVSGNAWITIKPQDAGEHDWEGVIGFEAKNGTFDTYIKPGDYRVVNVGSHNFWFDVNIPFTVENDNSVTINEKYWDADNEQVIIRERSPNVSATVYAEVNGVDEPVIHGWLGIARFDTTGNQVKMSGESISQNELNQYDVIQWQFTRWYEIKDDGSFEAALDETDNGAYYRILHVNGQAQGNWVGYAPKLDFVVDLDGSKLRGSETPFTEVHEPTANVTVKIINAQTNAEMGWLDLVVTKEGGKKFFIPMPFIEKTEGVFIFEGYLDEGTYRVQNFGTYDFFKEIKQEFTVSGLPNGILEIDLQDDTLKVVKGSVTNGDSNTWVTIQMVENEVILNDELNTKSVKANGFGEFSFELREGETWTVVNINTPNGYQDIADALTKAYTVTDVQQQMPSQWQNIGQ